MINSKLESKDLEKQTKTRWTNLLILWSVYLFVVFTFAKTSHYRQGIIWGGAFVVVYKFFAVFQSYYKQYKLPTEGKLLLMFCLWSFTGVIYATDMVLFFQYYKYIIELTILVILISAIIKYSGDVKWFYIAFIGIAIFRVFYRIEDFGLDQITNPGTDFRRYEDSNALGYFAFMGILSLFGLWMETKSNILRLMLVGLAMISLYGLLYSASRGALVSLIVLVLLWPPLCLVDGARNKMLALLVSAVFIAVAYQGIRFIMLETYLGWRFQTMMEDNAYTEMARFQLIQIGWDLFLKNPILGYGLGQFGEASGTGRYAHNEFIEIAATTGIPGVVLYYSVFLNTWRRLSWSLKKIRHPYYRYRLNMARIGLIVLLISGFIFSPNFILQSTMFLLAITIGISQWAVRKINLSIREDDSQKPQTGKRITSSKTRNSEMLAR
ncbi:O-antigen ligase family protein [bacterium]|nr:O-antigen ligase family protein [candidate division CSSED10-310 bacterium]